MRGEEGGRRGELPPPPPSSPPGYFTYLQPKRPSTLTAIMTGSSPSLLGTGHLLYFFRGGGLLSGSVLSWVKNEKMMGSCSHKLLPVCYYSSLDVSSSYVASTVGHNGRLYIKPGPADAHGPV